MSDDFAPLVDALGDVARSIDPRARKRLTGAIAAGLRTTNARRLAANIQPDGSAMVPRKVQSESRRAARLRETRPPSRRGERMFRKAGAARFLHRENDEVEARVGFGGRTARIMAVHQYGLRDHVTRDAGSPEVTYPTRVVLGMTAEDRARILDQVAAALL